MTETIQLDTHYDCTRTHRITELEGPEHLASLMPGTIILVRGWEYLHLAGGMGWVNTHGIRYPDWQMWEVLAATKYRDHKVSLLHVGAA